VAGEARRPRVVTALRDRRALAALHAVEADPVEALGLVVAIRDPLTIRAPDGVAGLPHLRPRHLDDALRVHLHVDESILLVAPEELLRVGAPADLVLVRVRPGRQLPWLAAAVGGDDPDLVLAGGVADVGDQFAVGRPLG